MVTIKCCIRELGNRYLKKYGLDTEAMQFQTIAKHAFQVGFRCAWNLRNKILMEKKDAHPVRKAKTPAQDTKEICHTAPNT
jgi:hypothetical protein